MTTTTTKTEVKHTPGPWTRSGRGIVTGRGTICLAPNLPEGGVFDKEANLSLIAAAPDLLKALEGLITSIDKFGLRLTRDDGYFDEAEAAVRKAKGEQP